MSNWVLRSRSGFISDSDMQKMNRRDDVIILEQTTRMILVETSSATASELADTLPEMIVVPEQNGIRIPKPHPKVQESA